jgi:dTDP-4-dehydrorhamnose reductase
MKVVLLGPNGQLGVDITKNFSTDPAIELKSLTRADLDLSNIAQISEVLSAIDFDVLINTTGYHKTDEVESNAQQGVLINAQVPAELAKVCVAKGARLVHLSTDYVFGGQEKRAPLSEEDTPAPLNVYGSTKLLGEGMVRKISPDAIICRVSSLFGVAGASGKGGNFVETMIRLAKERGGLKVVSDQIMAPTSTPDIAEAIARLIKAEAPGGIYHVAGTGQASWYEFAKEIMVQVGMGSIPVDPVTTADMPTPAMRPPYSVLNNGKLAQATGWAMPPWRDSLKRYLVEKGHVAS